MARVRLSVAAGAAAFCVALLALGAGGAGAAEPCSGADLYLAAHEDDTLLFESPALLESIQAGHCVRTVFLTAGDSGAGAEYWEGREAGVEAAYAQMAGVGDAWSGSEVEADGHEIAAETLSGAPGVSIYYLRLPDGGVDGEGFPAYGNQSLLKLWNSAHGGSPSIAEMETVDGSETYSYQGLVKTLTALMESFGAEQIATQNYGLAFVGPDHADHVGTGRFTRVAQEAFAAPHLMTAYRGYDTASKEENVFAAALAEKSSAFYAYGADDKEACASAEKCIGTSYAKWLKREYVAASESTPGAVVGADQEVLVGEAVQLDGSASFDPGGGTLQYEWTQTEGPEVELSDPAAAQPTFLAPGAPATLEFSLTVTNGTRSSAPATLAVEVGRVAAPAPPHDRGGPPGEGGPPAPPGEGVPVRLSQVRVALVAGRRSHRLIKLTAPGDPVVRCRGVLPAGAKCRVTAGKDVVIEASKAVRRAGAYRLLIDVTGQSGTVTRPLLVVFRRAKAA